MSTKLRKEVKNLCERVGIQLQSGIRQLENLRRISRSLMGEDEREERGLQLHQEIQNIFCLSESASKCVQPATWSRIDFRLTMSVSGR